MKRLTFPKQQRGVALITAILIAALVTVAAVAMASRQQLDVRRTGNMLEADQAYMYALAAETWATQILVEDNKKTDIDALDEEWATDLPPVPIEGGAIGGKIEDLQGRFNLNNLVDSKGEMDEGQVKAFQTILEQVSLADQQLNLSPFLANRVVDWIDNNLQSSADGAEDLEYLGKPVPYRAANGLMSSPSELAAVAGFSLHATKVLSRGRPAVSDTQPGLPPLVTSLPEYTKVNVNTAPAIVLMSLHKDITPRIAEELEQLRNDGAFEKVADFINKLKDDYEIELDPKYVDVQSKYFLASIDAAIGRTQLRLYSLLARKDGKVITIRRSLGAL
jgi:general secretion pathway protein K